jgi:hypothetical protein
VHALISAALAAQLVLREYSEHAATAAATAADAMPASGLVRAGGAELGVDAATAAATATDAAPASGLVRAGGAGLGTEEAALLRCAEQKLLRQY